MKYRYHFLILSFMLFCVMFEEVVPLNQEYLFYFSVFYLVGLVFYMLKLASVEIFLLLNKDHFFKYRDIFSMRRYFYKWINEVFKPMKRTDKESKGSSLFFSKKK